MTVKVSCRLFLCVTWPAFALLSPSAAHPAVWVWPLLFFAFSCFFVFFPLRLWIRHRLLLSSHTLPLPPPAPLTHIFRCAHFAPLLLSLAPQFSVIRLFLDSPSPCVCPATIRTWFAVHRQSHRVFFIYPHCLPCLAPRPCSPGHYEGHSGSTPFFPLLHRTSQRTATLHQR